MNTFIIAATIYLSIGWGFALASWLQAAELEVLAGSKPSPFVSRVGTLFVLIWPLLAIYCYRVEVSRTIEPVDFDKIKGKNNDEK